MNYHEMKISEWMELVEELCYLMGCEIQNLDIDWRAAYIRCENPQKLVYEAIWEEGWKS